jgi:hypothetical protein
MVSCSEARIGATCALAGSVVLAVGTSLHPLDADPNEAVAAFTEYAADRLWVASHLTQLAGVALMVWSASVTTALSAGKPSSYSLNFRMHTQAQS